VNNALAPDHQAFKALVVRTRDLLPVPGVKKLFDYACSGLPIVFYGGGVPTKPYSKANQSAVVYINATMNYLATLDNVHVVPTSLADKLGDLESYPWLVSHRRVCGMPIGAPTVVTIPTTSLFIVTPGTGRMEPLSSKLLRFLIGMTPILVKRAQF
jgi:hypothetical protein